MEKILSLAALCAVLAGCAGVDYYPNSTQGYTHYDPCTRCGESWQRLPNPAFNAIHIADHAEWRSNRSRRQSLARMYGPDWAEQLPELDQRYALDELDTADN